MLQIGLPCLRKNRSFLQDLSRAISRFSRGPVAGNHRQHFFNPTGSNTITISDRSQKNDPIGDCNPVGSKKCWRWFPATRPLEKRETALDRSWRKLPSHSEARKTNFQHFRGKSSCERTERCFFNWLQIQLHKNWPYIKDWGCMHMWTQNSSIWWCTCTCVHAICFLSQTLGRFFGQLSSCVTFPGTPWRGNLYDSRRECCCRTIVYRAARRGHCSKRFSRGRACVRCV